MHLWHMFVHWYQRRNAWQSRMAFRSPFHPNHAARQLLFVRGRPAIRRRSASACGLPSCRRAGPSPSARHRMDHAISSATAAWACAFTCMQGRPTQQHVCSTIPAFASERLACGKMTHGNLMSQTLDDAAMERQKAGNYIGASKLHRPRRKLRIRSIHQTPDWKRILRRPYGI